MINDKNGKNQINGSKAVRTCVIRNKVADGHLGFSKTSFLKTSFLKISFLSMMPSQILVKIINSKYDLI